MWQEGVFGETKEKVLHCAFYFPWNSKTSIMLVFLETGEGIHPHKIHWGLLACSLKMQNYCFCKWATKHLEVVKVNLGATIWAHINNSYTYIKKTFFRFYECESFVLVWVKYYTQFTIMGFFYSFLHIFKTYQICQVKKSADVLNSNIKHRPLQCTMYQNWQISNTFTCSRLVISNDIS